MGGDEAIIEGVYVWTSLVINTLRIPLD